MNELCFILNVRKIRYFFFYFEININKINCFDGGSETKMQMFFQVETDFLSCMYLSIEKMIFDLF